MMNPRHLYFIRTNEKFLAYQGQKKSCVLSFVRYNDGIHVFQFIRNRAIKIRKKRDGSYYLLRSNKPYTKHDTDFNILRATPDDILPDFMVNNINIDIIDEINQKNDTTIEMHSNYINNIINDFETDNDIDILYKLNLESIYMGTKFNISEFLESLNNPLGNDSDDDDA